MNYSSDTRGSTYEQDLTAQRSALEKLGVDPRYTCTDHGLTGTNRERPGLRIALAACREGDTLVVAKLDRLARSLHDASDISSCSLPSADRAGPALRCSQGSELEDERLTIRRRRQE
jgi:hypothetical protein